MIFFSFIFFYPPELPGSHPRIIFWRAIVLSGKMIEAGHPDSNLYTVRGWLMDELERRDPEAFDRWLSVDGFPTDESLYDYYPC
jgi:hypothetical protein